MEKFRAISMERFWRNEYDSANLEARVIIMELDSL